MEHNRGNEHTLKTIRKPVPVQIQFHSGVRYLNVKELELTYTMNNGGPENKGV